MTIKTLILAGLVAAGSVTAAAQRPHVVGSDARPMENSNACIRFTLVEVRSRETRSVMRSVGRRTAKASTDCRISTVIFAVPGTFQDVHDAASDDPKGNKGIRAIYNWHRELHEEIFRFYPHGRN